MKNPAKATKHGGNRITWISPYVESKAGSAQAGWLGFLVEARLKNHVNPAISVRTHHVAGLVSAVMRAQKNRHARTKEPRGDNFFVVIDVEK